MKKSKVNVLIDNEIRQSLQRLTEELNGIVNAANFLDIGLKTLQGYLDGSKKEIRKDIWNDILVPALNKSREDLITQYASELRRLRNDNKYLEQTIQLSEYLNKEHKEQFEKELSSPFNIYFKLYRSHRSIYEYPIIHDIAEIKEGRTVPFDQLIRNVDEFKRLYELFRPETITHDHHYHGTVQIIDAIFSVFSQVFEIRYHSQFSKYGMNMVEQIYKKRGIEEIHWEDLLQDLKFIAKSIGEAIANLALDSVEYFKKRHSFHFADLVYEYIYDRYVIESTNGFEKKDIQPGLIQNENVNIAFRNSSDLFHQLYSQFTIRKWNDE